jgi:hypothetical protein
MVRRGLVLARRRRPCGITMAQTVRVATLYPLGLGAIAVLITILIHALPLSAVLTFLRHERRAGRTGTSFWNDFGIVTLSMLLTLSAHLVEIAVWAFLFIFCGEFTSLGNAYYHSAVNYTTLGYGDVIMTPSWRLLGPLEAADGMLMFGVSTAMIFALIQWLIQARFADLRG